MKKVFWISALLFVFTLSGCSLSNNNQTKIDNKELKTQASDTQQQSKDKDINYGLVGENTDMTKCDFWKDKNFEKVDPYSVKTSAKDGAGSLILDGKLLQRVEDALFAENGEKVTKVYLVFDNPINETQRIFYDYYLESVAKGNGINSVDGQKLLFRLGVIKNSKLTTSADISEELKDRIVSFVGKDTSIQLKLTIPIYPGGGAVDDSSFACSISE